MRMSLAPMARAACTKAICGSKRLAGTRRAKPGTFTMASAWMAFIRFGEQRDDAERLDELGNASRHP
jgi:hypothetical protein